jgi:regulatory protein YycI of two-component signal transduction system YycFG
MKIIVLTLILVFTIACRNGDNTTNSTVQNSAQSNTKVVNSTASGEFAVGDKVLYLSSSGQRFYEATITALEGKKARLKYNDESVESDIADVYRLPKPGEKKNIKVGDIVAARFGQTAVWAGAEVTAVDGDKITVKWLSTGKPEEVSSDNILTLSDATQVRVKYAFKT